MNKLGVIYLMKSAIEGVYKIGISNVENFEERMRNLEKNGYSNIVGLKRKIAIKTENFIEKEKMLHEIFAKSRISDTEFFAIDGNLAERLFLSLDGEVIFPRDTNNNLEISNLDKANSDKISRSIFVDFVRGEFHKNPDALRGLLGDKEEFKIPKTRIRIFSEEFFGKSGTKLTAEIDSNLHIYATFSRQELERAIEDYRKLFNGEL